jgi:hypothetical protein
MMIINKSNAYTELCRRSLIINDEGDCEDFCCTDDSSYYLFASRHDDLLGMAYGILYKTRSNSVKDILRQFKFDKKTKMLYE